MSIPMLTSDETTMIGADRAALEAAWTTLVAAAHRHEFGGAVALVALDGRIVLHRATGWAVREPADERTPMAVDTIFDLASITKVTACLPSVLQLVSAGRIGLDQPVGEILPEFGTEGLKAGVTIRRLLTHSAGLKDWIPVYVDAHGADAYLRHFAATQPEWEPGTKYAYSDPSFITLGLVVERVTGESIADYARREVFTPLGMIDTRYSPLAGVRARIAGTEVGNAFEHAKVPGHTPAIGAWRKGLLRGEVHDGNAWYGFGGVAGHAGLFGTAIDLARYATAWLGGTVPGIAPDLQAQAQRCQSAFAGDRDRRGFGWRLTAVPNDEPEDSGLGHGPNAFGHTGFTGPSLWIDPDTKLVVVFLANRVHPTVTPNYMATRAAFNAAIAGAVR